MCQDAVLGTWLSFNTLPQLCPSEMIKGRKSILPLVIDNKRKVVVSLWETFTLTLTKYLLLEPHVWSLSPPTLDRREVGSAPSALTLTGTFILNLWVVPLQRDSSNSHFVQRNLWNVYSEDILTCNTNIHFLKMLIFKQLFRNNFVGGKRIDEGVNRKRFSLWMSESNHHLGFM